MGHLYHGKLLKNQRVYIYIHIEFIKFHQAFFDSFTKSRWSRIGCGSTISTMQPAVPSYRPQDIKKNGMGALEKHLGLVCCWQMLGTWSSRAKSQLEPGTQKWLLNQQRFFKFISLSKRWIHNFLKQFFLARTSPLLLVNKCTVSFFFLLHIPQT